MKKHAAVVLAFAVALFPAGAFASCPDSNTYCFGNYCYTVFSFDTSCASVSGNVESETMSCYNWPADEFENGGGSVDYEMTVPYGLSGDYWSTQLYVDFNDPVQYFGDNITATVIVRHNGSVASYLIFSCTRASKAR